MTLAAVPASPLDRLAREIRVEHQAAAFETAVARARRCGELLLEAKSLTAT